MQHSYLKQIIFIPKQNSVKRKAVLGKKFQLQFVEWIFYGDCQNDNPKQIETADSMSASHR